MHASCYEYITTAVDNPPHAKQLNQLKHCSLVMFGKYYTRGGVSWQIQHSALLYAAFALTPQVVATACTFYTSLCALKYS